MDVICGAGLNKLSQPHMSLIINTRLIDSLSVCGCLRAPPLLTFGRPFFFFYFFKIILPDTNPPAPTPTFAQHKLVIRTVQVFNAP